MPQERAEYHKQGIQRYVDPKIPILFPLEFTAQQKGYGFHLFSVGGLELFCYSSLLFKLGDELRPPPKPAGIQIYSASSVKSYGPSSYTSSYGLSGSEKYPTRLTLTYSGGPISTSSGLKRTMFVPDPIALGYMKPS
jgi:hypothetical protein